MSQRRSDWQHPIHVHFEEFQILSGAPGLYPLSGDSSGWGGGGWDSSGGWNGGGSGTPSGVTLARKDVVRLTDDTQPSIFFRFRDFVGRYVMHCHNVVHEDHAMMTTSIRRSTGTGPGTAA